MHRLANIMVVLNQFFDCDWYLILSHIFGFVSSRKLPSEESQRASLDHAASLYKMKLRAARESTQSSSGGKRKLANEQKPKKRIATHKSKEID